MDLLGKQLGGCRLDRLIGQGGMGEVYLATQLSLEREVAVKVLNQNLAANVEFRERFKREARSIAKVNHPNILQIFEVGEQDGVHFMLMEFIDGESIASRLDRDGFIPWHEAAELVCQAAEGLQSAAGVGIMHRDIKPDNLMVTRAGQVKVSDFGLAKQAQVDLTQTNTVMGTPAYMSPEQCDGANLDTRTDIYSLGATFYRMITGVLPFNAPSPMAIMYKHKHEPPTPPQRYMPNIPEDLSYIILRMMEKIPDRRYPTMNAVLSAIDRCLQNHPVGSTGSAEMTLRLEGGFDFDTPPPSPTGSGRTVSRKRSTVSIPAVSVRDTPPRKTVDDYVREGDELMAAGHPSAAMDAWKQALAIQPDHTDLKSRIEHSTGESARFSRQLGEALLNRGNIADLRRTLFERLSQNGDDVEAREQLQALDEMERDKRDVVSRIRVLLGANDYQKALELWDGLHPELREQALEKSIAHVRSVVMPLLKLVDEARLHAESGNYEAAIALYERAAALDTNHELVRSGIRDTRHILDRIEQYLRDAYEAAIDGRHEEAVAHYRRVLDLSPGHAKARQLAIENQLALAEAAERKSDVSTAHAAWAAVLAFDRDHPRAVERAGALSAKLASINERLAQAQRMDRTGRLGAAVSLYSNVLRDDPENRRARFGLQDARRARFVRRRLPGALLLLAILGGLGGVGWYRCNQGMTEGNQLFARGEFSEAIAAWERAAAVPLCGGLVMPEAREMIRRAGFLERTGKIESITVHSDFLKESKAFRTELDTAAGFPEQGTIRLRLLLTEAFLQYRSGDLETAASEYNKARAFAAAGKLPLPREHQPRMDGLTAYWNGRKAEKLADIHSAMSYYDAAQRHLPDLSDAIRRRERLSEELANAQTAGTRARELFARGVAASGWETQATLWREAQALGREALRADPANQEVRAAMLEIQWRLDAGPDMVFFRVDENTAFAIDRHEFPNRPGAMPERLSFFDARQKAASLNKALPTRREWEHAARGAREGRRKYPYGNSFDPSASCNSVSGVVRLAPEPSGSYPKGNTPEGITDMTGNVAEWVDDNVPATARLANAMGGHFASTKDYDLSCDTQKQYRTDMADAHVGFRCVRRYTAQSTPLVLDK